MAYDEGVIGLHAKIKVRKTKMIEGEMYSQIIETTMGRIIFNDPIPQDLGYVDRSKPENMFKLGSRVLSWQKGSLGQIIEKCIRVHGTATTAEVLDKIKAQGFKYSTRSAITVAVCDAVIPPEKKALIGRSRSEDRKNHQAVPQGTYSLMRSGIRWSLRPGMKPLTRWRMR